GGNGNYLPQLKGGRRSGEAAASEALSNRTQEWALDATRQGIRFSRMNHGKKKFSGSRQDSKKGPPLGLVIALAAAGGVVIGSAGTYFLSKPSAAPKHSASPRACGAPVR